MKRYDDSWKEFAEDGSEYLTDDDLVAKDLDIMGKNSIYQFICVAGTEDGRQMLAETLRQPEFAAEDRTKRQIAIQELAEKHDFSMDFETLCVKSETGKKKNIHPMNLLPIVPVMIIYRRFSKCFVFCFR